MRNKDLVKNTLVEQTFVTATTGTWTKIVEWNKVDREYFGFNVKGQDAATRVLITTDPTADDNAAFEVNQGFLATSEWLFLRSDFYAKVVDGGLDTVISTWQSKAS
jgi:hypothetical protein